MRLCFLALHAALGAALTLACSSGAESGGSADAGQCSSPGLFAEASEGACRPADRGALDDSGQVSAPAPATGAPLDPCSQCVESHCDLQSVPLCTDCIEFVTCYEAAGINTQEQEVCAQADLDETSCAQPSALVGTCMSSTCSAQCQNASVGVGDVIASVCGADPASCADLLETCCESSAMPAIGVSACKSVASAGDDTACQSILSVFLAAGYCG
jgi:hypothetical protein